MIPLPGKYVGILAAVLLCLCLLFLPLPSHAASVTVEVEGVKGGLYDNIMATLKIALQQDNAELNSRQIRRLHKQAEAQIREALAPFGYYSVQVDGSLEQKDGGWQALYRVNPGKRITIASLSLTLSGPGADNALLQDLEKNFPLQAGDQLTDSVYEAGKKKALSWVVARGYIKARFTEHSVRVSRGKESADIHLVLDTGPLFYFAETSSDQQVITQDLFQRYISYKVGDVYSLKQLNRLQSDLYGSGFFKEVLVEPQLDEKGENIPVHVRAVPAKKNRYSLGIGYGTDTGYRGSVGWKNRIINRHGHKPGISAQLAEKESRFNANYEIPVFDPRYDAVLLDALYLDDTWDDTWTKQLSFSVSANHHTPKNQFGVGLEYRHEEYTVGVTSGTAELLMPSLYWTGIFARDRINTENGVRLSGTLRAGSESVFSSTSFMQFRFSGKLILSPLNNWRILARGTVGATKMDSIDELPPSLRFYAGGDQSVRGYSYRELGPTDSSGVVVGGQYLFVNSIELERKLVSVWSVAAFYDVGNAFDDLDTDLKQGAGVGVRMTLPFGQVRMDVASALSEEGYPWRVHITVGADL
jgi:translocation and assembly module TamA